MQTSQLKDTTWKCSRALCWSVSKYFMQYFNFYPFISSWILRYVIGVLRNHRLVLFVSGSWLLSGSLPKNMSVKKVIHTFRLLDFFLEESRRNILFVSAGSFKLDHSWISWAIFVLLLLTNLAPILFGYPWIASKCHGKCQQNPNWWPTDICTCLLLEHLSAQI